MPCYIPYVSQDWTGAAWPAGSREALLAESGEPLAGGYFGVLWMMKGDLDYFAKVLRLRHYSQEQFCDFCPATRHEPFSMNAFNFRTDASWKGQCYTSWQWRHLNPERHPIFQRSYLTQHNIEPDDLHVVHLGTSMYLLGSILWLLAFRMLPQTPFQNIAGEMVEPVH